VDNPHLEKTEHITAKMKENVKLVVITKAELERLRIESAIKRLRKHNEKTH